MTPLVSWGVCY